MLLHLIKKSDFDTTEKQRRTQGKVINHYLRLSLCSEQRLGVLGGPILFIKNKKLRL